MGPVGAIRLLKSGVGPEAVFPRPFVRSRLSTTWALYQLDTASVHRLRTQSSRVRVLDFHLFRSTANQAVLVVFLNRLAFTASPWRILALVSRMPGLATIALSER